MSKLLGWVQPFTASQVELSDSEMVSDDENNPLGLNSLSRMERPGYEREWQRIE